MSIGHRDAAHHSPDDTNKTLIRPTQKDVVQMSRPVEDLVWGSVDGSVVMPRKAFDGRWRKNVRVDHVRPEIRGEADAGRDTAVVPFKFRPLVLVFAQRCPAVEVGDRGDSNNTLRQ